MSVINVLMQLRKVCNHPSLFDPRPIISPFQSEGISYYTSSFVLKALEYDPLRVSINENSFKKGFRGLLCLTPHSTIF
jgi:E1A-binding protein p400